MAAEPDVRLSEWEGHDAEHWQRTWNAGGVHLFRSTASTNDTLSRLAANGAPNFTVVLAEEQSRGRGRGGSSWSAAPGTALLFSVLFRPSPPGGAPGCAPIRVGIAVAQAIEGARVKWPNDVVIPGHGKVAGILCEGVFGSHVVAGVGINVLQGREDFPAELRGRACSVQSVRGEPVGRAELLTRVLASLHAFADRIADPLNAGEITLFDQLDILRGQHIAGENGVDGIAAGVASDGALLVDTAAERVRVYNATVRLADNHAYPGTRTQGTT